MDAITLRKYSCDNPPQATMPRTKSVTEAYEKFKNTPGQKAFLDAVGMYLIVNPYYFCPNSFPYDVAHPIQHSCLWYRGEFSPAQVTEFLAKERIDVITFFENPEHLKSVKTISHYHVFHY